MAGELTRRAVGDPVKGEQLKQALIEALSQRR
jgi:hypothetical protein